MSRDRFRQEYRELSTEERDAVFMVKEFAGGIMETLECKKLTNLDHRCAMIASAKLEEAVMWATKAITAPEVR